MKEIFLIKYGEISLKGNNQKSFIIRLKNNIKKNLPDIKTVIYHKMGRLYLECNQKDKAQVAKILTLTFGITGFAEAFMVEKDIECIDEKALLIAAQLTAANAGSCFKIECRRADKSFAFSSYQIACRLGAIILKNFPGLSVNLNHPDWIINVEVREKVSLYGLQTKGQGGLPVGCAGKGLLLLSGGIDSPVACYLMGKRGLDMDAVYFHTYPFTSDAVLDKVKKLSELLSVYFVSFNLFVVPFTDLQVKIKETATKNEVTLHSRAAMMYLSDRIAKHHNKLCLITGESLSQVASQTPESLRFTGSFTNLPVLRPLIGMDKQDIIKIARSISTYEVSIQPFLDCCSIFAPVHPLIKPNFEQTIEKNKDLHLDELLEKALANVEKIVIKE